MRYYTKLSLFTAIAILSACATSQNYNTKLNQELGKTTEQLINTYGQPSQIKLLNNGDEIISYISINYQILPSPDAFYNTNFMTEDEMFYPFTYGGNEIPVGNFMGETITDYCNTKFYIKNNRVASWQWRGNACVAL